MLDLSSLGLIVAIPVFLAAAVVVWLAGTRMTGYADVISEKTGMGQALAGILLLGGVTSLPEVAVAVTSSTSGDTALAVNGILGGISMQVAILAIADVMIRRRALTSVIPDPGVILQGSFDILLLTIVTAAFIVGDVLFLGAGVWMWLLLIASGTCLWILSRVKGQKPWIANDPRGEVTMEKEDELARAQSHAGETSLRSVAVRALIAGSVIVAAGYVLSRTADAIAQGTGLGQSFAGFVFLAIATSLPEVSTVTTAVRSGLYTMAVSDIFGTNLFDIALLWVIDILGSGEAVMNRVDAFSGFATIIGITVTALMIAGLAERRDRTVLRMGYDTSAVLAVYLSGLVVLYFLR